ncbi:hypothetical protein EV699_1405 [Plasticicumulans lactativorans]|uniref:Peptidase M16C associated domain-containing protein n=1 Tax=Plasticicumulans lactativorans TaxID=1133106 RepID=A0A4R2KSQ9_9GAMM|nr:insulinase family protein [Plasticicumulans lactativorans]TCO75777.1 hypothetical protein EV699_1405 [Plasticicumulans lactativorans]
MTHPAFEHLRTREIPALKLALEEYRHRVTGARHLHLAAADPHNAFLVAFLTVPQDSTGVAHILEHTALCGSRRYPVRDPFFMMTRRSLNTFMNAFTASDWTAYPFASQNRKDFDNLLAVYLDAAFFPLLDARDFAQEGHRLEFADPADPASPLVLKGVVYNEMKGAMSSPVQALAQHLQTALFPTTTYHVNSGGDPAHIPELTYEQLVAFHAAHYHPSNAVFMTYGDIPAAEHQARFEARALAQFQARPLDLAVPDERRYGAPQQRELRYPVPADETAENTHVVLGWLLGRSTDPLETLRARVLAEVLLDNASSPLRHALETCGIGAAPSPLCGFDDSTRETTFVCGLEGCEPEDAEAVERLVFEVLAEVAEHGVEPAALDAVLHQIELQSREISGDGYPYGLKLMLDALAPQLHGGDPLCALDIDPTLDAVRAEARAPGFVQGLVRRLLLDNPHRVRLTMRPDPALADAQARAEAERLERIRAGLDAAGRQRILDATAALAARQAQVDDPEQLPKVTLADVPADLPIPQAERRTLAGLPAAWYAQPTNGMVYQQWIIDLPALPEPLLERLPLYALTLAEVGSGGRDYLATQALQAAVTGGLSARCMARAPVATGDAVRAVLVLAGKALARNHAALGALLRDTLLAPRFDEATRLRELVAQYRAQRDEELTERGHVLAMSAACAPLSPSAALLERWGGLASVQALRALDDALDDPAALAAYAADLAALHALIVAAPRRLLVVAEGERHAELEAALATLWAGDAPPPPPAAEPAAFAVPTVAGAAHTAWVVGTQVNFCATAYPAVPVGHTDAAALLVLGDYLRNGWLHRAIREQGGAYGAGAGYQGDAVVFRFFSYRDPRLDATLADFGRALGWLDGDGHTAQALEEAILGVIAAIDRPGSPAGEAITAHLNELFGRSAEQRRALRAQVLGVSLDDLRRVAHRYLAPERAVSVVVTHRGALAGSALDFAVHTP